MSFVKLKQLTVEAQSSPAQVRIEGAPFFSGLFEVSASLASAAECRAVSRISGTQNFVLSRSDVCGLKLARHPAGFECDGIGAFLFTLRQDAEAEKSILTVHDLSQSFEIDASLQEHLPKKCMRFFDKDMLHGIKSGASSFAERDSAFGGRALAAQTSLTCLFVPRSRILRVFANELALHGQTLSCALPSGDILGTGVGRFMNRASEMTSSQFDAAANGLVDLAASIFNERIKVALGPALGAPLASFVSIRRFIDQNLTTKSMNADTLAETFGLSRATLYRLFEPVGGVGNYIRSVRLAKAYQEIIAPQNANHRTSHIALRLGFPSAAAFVRLFQDVYGCTPTQARKRALDRLVNEHVVMLEREAGTLQRFVSAMLN